VRQVFDSDGRRYRQLVKSGNDDMRQDAVMQQFFQLVNVLLATDPATRRRQLHISIYKVQPWSESAPLIIGLQTSQQTSTGFRVGLTWISTARARLSG